MLAYNSEMDEAISVIDQNSTANPNAPLAKFGLILKYAIRGERGRALRQMTPDLHRYIQRDPYFAHLASSFYSLVGEQKEALYWLDETVDAGFINYPFFNEYDPFLENIRGEERFKKLMGRVKHEWENFEVE